MVDDKPMRIGWVFYFTYIFIAIIFHLFISLCYCLSLDMAEANSVVFLLKPGTISLLFLLLPARRFRTRLLATLSSALITLVFNQWHLVAGNKELVLCLQAACLAAFLSMTSIKNTGGLLAHPYFWFVRLERFASAGWNRRLTLQIYILLMMGRAVAPAVTASSILQQKAAG